MIFRVWVEIFGDRVEIFGVREEIFGFRVDIFGFQVEIFRFRVRERLPARDDGLHQQLAPPRPAGGPWYVPNLPGIRV